MLIRIAALALLAACGSSPAGNGGKTTKSTGECEGLDCVEVCDDGIDNNGNNLADCFDPACSDSCPEICDDGIDNDNDANTDCADDECTSTCDADGDGFDNWAAGGDDCDDTDPEIHPDATEVCNGYDDNCNGWVDRDDADLDPNSIQQWYLDYDGDGYGTPSVGEWNCFQPPGYVNNAEDCDDNDALHNPLTPEICNGLDDNCDTLVDDADPLVDLSTATTYYADTDGDGLGDPNAPTDFCALPPNGYVTNTDDCDDTDFEILGASMWVPDLDGDGYGDGVPYGAVSCTPPGPNTAPDYLPPDCDETNPIIYPGAYEYCGDYQDWNCDGQDCAEFLEDWETGSIQPAWSNTGSAVWFVQSSTVQSGAFAAECGNINDNQVSTLSITLDYPIDGDISFWHTGDTESGWDYLEFSIDGVLQNSWSGNWSWQQTSYPILAGNHTFTWEYDKDGSVSTGADTVWIDEIYAFGAVPP